MSEHAKEVPPVREYQQAIFEGRLSKLQVRSLLFLANASDPEAGAPMSSIAETMPENQRKALCMMASLARQILASPAVRQAAEDQAGAADE